MPHDVIMPALGMAQDTGLIVSWRKSAGDQVAAEDILFDVETDKATMEVQAGADGYLADVRFDAGAEVPVGKVIAIIVPEVPDSTGSERAFMPISTPSSVGVASKAPQHDVSTKIEPPERLSETGARILASPKAKRLAAEEGFDLGLLMSAGLPQPYHAVDLQALRTLAAVARDGKASDAPLTIKSQAPIAGLADFETWMASEIPVSRERIWAAFASASLRQATGAANILVRVDLPTAERSLSFRNADQCPMSRIEQAGADAPDLIVRELPGNRTADADVRGLEGHALSISTEGDHFMLALMFDSDKLDASHAREFVDGFARRIDNPLRQLL